MNTLELGNSSDSTANAFVPTNLTVEVVRKKMNGLTVSGSCECASGDCCGR